MIIFNKKEEIINLNIFKYMCPEKKNEKKFKCKGLLEDQP